MTNGHFQETSRNQVFADQLTTNITDETPSKENPFIADVIRIHGYSHRDLMAQCDPVDVIYLLFRGELPDPRHRECFKRLFIALINPGPRHPATQAGITATAGKTARPHILPIALSIYSGDVDGVADVDLAMKSFPTIADQEMSKTVDDIIKSAIDIPGIGSVYGGRDSYTAKLLNDIEAVACGDRVPWLRALNDQLQPYNIGALRAGLCAAALLDLGFSHRQGCALMQLFAAPGLIAHSLEYANRKPTDMFFESDESYVYTGPEQPADPTR